MMLSCQLWKSLCMLMSRPYDFANVKQCDNKANIIYCLKLKFADIIATDMNAVQ